MSLNRSIWGMIIASVILCPLVAACSEEPTDGTLDTMRSDSVPTLLSALREDDAISSQGATVEHRLAVLGKLIPSFLGDDRPQVQSFATTQIFHAHGATLTSPTGTVKATTIQFSGTTSPAGVTGPVKWLPDQGCTQRGHGIDVDNFVAVVDRGGCTFARKSAVAQRLGAKALVVINSDDTDPVDWRVLPSSKPIPLIGVARAAASSLVDGELVTVRVDADTETSVGHYLMVGTRPEHTTTDAAPVVLVSASIDQLPALATAIHTFQLVDVEAKSPARVRLLVSEGEVPRAEILSAAMSYAGEFAPTTEPQRSLVVGVRSGSSSQGSVSTAIVPGSDGALVDIAESISANLERAGWSTRPAEVTPHPSTSTVTVTTPSTSDNETTRMLTEITRVIATALTET